jgi:hypothetical protein
MGAEKWVAKNEFWDCCASSFCVFKVWVWEKEFTFKEREERQRQREVQMHEGAKCTLIMNQANETETWAFHEFWGYCANLFCVCEKEETTGEDICGSKKHKMGIQKLSHKQKHTHTHTPISDVYANLYTTVYIKSMYLCVYVCMYVCMCV